MKKTFAALIFLIAAIALSGCGNEQDKVTEFTTFSATVIEPGIDFFIVAPDEGTNEYKSSDKIAVYMYQDAVMLGIDGGTILNSDLKEGDRVSITYDGAIRESYPAQISATGVTVTE